MIRRKRETERERDSCSCSVQKFKAAKAEEAAAAARKGSQKANDNRLKVFRISGILSSVAKTFYQTRTREQTTPGGSGKGRLHIEAARCTCCICLLRVAFGIVRHLPLAKILNMLYSTLGKVRWDLLYWKGSGERQEEREEEIEREANDRNCWMSFNGSS